MCRPSGAQPPSGLQLSMFTLYEGNNYIVYNSLVSYQSPPRYFISQDNNCFFNQNYSKDV
jgi:hypothetical protein